VYSNYWKNNHNNKDLNQQLSHQTHMSTATKPLSSATLFTTSPTVIHKAPPNSSRVLLHISPFRPFFFAQTRLCRFYNLLIMSSSFTRLVLDIIIFATLKYLFIFPLITKLLDFVQGEQTTEETSTIYANLKAFIIGEEAEKKATTAAAFTIGNTQEDAECEKCGILLETQGCVKRTRCQCTWCAECVEECFELVEFEMDAPLTGLNRSCGAARSTTMREMLPWVREVLSEKPGGMLILWEVLRWGRMIGCLIVMMRMSRRTHYNDIAKIHEAVCKDVRDHHCECDKMMRLRLHNTVAVKSTY
jgi:hypothetical protein